MLHSNAAKGANVVVIAAVDGIATVVVVGTATAIVDGIGGMTDVDHLHVGMIVTMTEIIVVARHLVVVAVDPDLVLDRLLVTVREALAVAEAGIIMMIAGVMTTIGETVIVVTVVLIAAVIEEVTVVVIVVLIAVVIVVLIEAVTVVAAVTEVAIAMVVVAVVIAAVIEVVTVVVVVAIAALNVHRQRKHGFDVLLIKWENVYREL
mmetsp:Transcript_20942/g.34604  ORF Transcript_20942/g.34604 Transcript_20942/m.34604 type:complete len:206 (-) Transcript_20942:65-682(-)